VAVNVCGFTEVYDIPALIVPPIALDKARLNTVFPLPL
jgi:hypothetical protein